MRILIWTDAFAPQIGGLEVLTMHLGRSLLARGHDCTVITNRLGSSDLGLHYWHGLPVHGFAFESHQQQRNLAAIRADHHGVTQILHQFRPDVIHFHGLSRTFIAAMMSQRTVRHPAILTLHDGYLFRLLRQSIPALLENIDAVVAVSSSIRNEAVDARPDLAPRIQTILNALPTPETPIAPPPRCQKILAFGRLVEAKGFDVALRAFARLGKRYPGSSLTLVGDGPERDRLREQAAAPDLHGRVTFTGWIPPAEVDAVLAAHDLVVVPSRWQEPFGLVALQAAQMARPVVATRVGGLPEIIVDGETGILCPNEDDTAMASALERLLADPELAASMGHRAHERACGHFDFESFVRAYENLLGQVARHSSAA